MLRINPNQVAIWRDLNTLQIGTGRNRVLLDSLTKSQERLIAVLYRGIADKQLPTLLTDLGIDSDAGQSLVDSLQPMLLRETKRPKESLSEDFIASAFAEIIRASLLSSSDGASVILERKHRSVHIDDLSGSGLALALGLASAGLGTLVSHDLAKIEASDVGPSAYPSQLIGKSRLLGLQSLLASSPNQMKIVAGHTMSSSKLESIDCAVVIGHQAIEPRRYVQWMNRDVPHLAINFETDSAMVSPLVVPGRGPCLYCLEQSRINEDKSWPVVASQLIGQKHRFDDSASRLFCAGLAVQKILAHIDDIGGFGQTESELVGYRLCEGVVQEVRWAEHDACSCRSASS